MGNTKTYVYILIRYLLPIYILALVILTIFRGIFVYHFYDDFILLYKTTDELHPILLKAMAKGFRYDNIVLSYIMAIPLISLLIGWTTKISIKKLLTFYKIYFILAFAGLFALSCMDYPYFAYFWTHPTVTIFDWIGFGGTFGMVLQESSYYPYYLLFIIAMGSIIAVSHFCAKWASKEVYKISPLDHGFIQLSIFTVAGILCFFGTRGHLNKSSIGLNAAYFTDNKLVSDLCVNPAYHFMTYLDDYKVNFSELMSYDQALSKVQKYFQIDSDSINSKQILKRKIATDSTALATDMNIVLIFMESMGVNQLHQTEGEKFLTPFLDSLSASAYYFENIYSSGVHTNTGVGSTLISMPSLLHEHMMSRNPMTYNSILSELKKIGYHTSFFLPNEEVYDNMGLFLRANHIDTIFSDKHYPKDVKVNNFGVPDNYLLKFAIDKMNSLSQNGKPFFSAILTVSNHPPYVVADPFDKLSTNKEKSILAYADYALSNFFYEASEQEWYNNTIFVLLGDHGKRTSSMGYNMSLDYNHIPLIIYSPSFTEMPKQFNQFGGQIDVLPTVMGLMNKSYENNTLGLDILHKDKPYAYFTSDTYIGCVNENYFYTFNPRDKKENLYDRKTHKAVNKDSISQSMKDYSLSMLSTASYINEERLGENN